MKKVGKIGYIVSEDQRWSGGFVTYFRVGDKVEIIDGLDEDGEVKARRLSDGEEGFVLATALKKRPSTPTFKEGDRVRVTGPAINADGSYPSHYLSVGDTGTVRTIFPHGDVNVLKDEGGYSVGTVAATSLTLIDQEAPALQPEFNVGDEYVVIADGKTSNGGYCGVYKGEIVKIAKSALDWEGDVLVENERINYGQWIDPKLLSRIVEAEVVEDDGLRRYTSLLDVPVGMLVTSEIGWHIRLTPTLAHYNSGANPIDSGWIDFDPRRADQHDRVSIYTEVKL